MVTSGPDLKSCCRISNLVWSAVSPGFLPVIYLLLETAADEDFSAAVVAALALVQKVVGPVRVAKAEIRTLAVSILQADPKPHNFARSVIGSS